jgi:ribosomal protein L16 Arg81 hydroxylase
MYAANWPQESDDARPLGKGGASRFARLYPDSSGRMSHRLHRDPLFAFDRLAEIADAADPDGIECRARIGEDRFAVDARWRDRPGDAIRTLTESPRWVMMRDVQDWPVFSGPVNALLADIEETIAAGTGAPMRLRAFLFISTGGMLTPLHFDPEYNILFQIAGAKHFAVHPADSDLLDAQMLEAYYARGDNLLAWRPEHDARAKIEPLEPGDALYVPFKRPHWVRVGDAPSVSLSVTWRSTASLEHDDAWRLNEWLRRRKVKLPPPSDPPARSRVRACSYRALSRLGLD